MVSAEGAASTLALGNALGLFFETFVVFFLCKGMNPQKGKGTYEKSSFIREIEDSVSDQFSCRYPRYYRGINLGRWFLLQFDWVV